MHRRVMWRILRVIKNDDIFACTSRNVSKHFYWMMSSQIAWELFRNALKVTHKTHKAPPLVVIIALCFTQQLRPMRMWIYLKHAYYFLLPIVCKETSNLPSSLCIIFVFFWAKSLNLIHTIHIASEDLGHYQVLAFKCF